MTATPIWFGPEERTVCGWLHVPEGNSARAGVLLCPPLAGERISAYDCFRLVAESLATRGIAALRFDYPGTGDSYGPGEGELGVPDWVASIGDAAATLRRLGVERVVVVGMRIGATLAAAAGSVLGDIAAVAWWDPCESGRAFLRQQRSLNLVIFGAAESGGADTPGFFFPDAVADPIRALRLELPVSPVPVPTLLLVREEAAGPELAAAFADAGATVVSVRGQPEFLDISSLEAEIPHSTIVQLVDWVDGILPAERQALGTIGESSVVLRVDGVAIREHAQRLGPIGLFSIVTEPAQPTLPPRAAGAPSQPAVIFLNPATESHIGPARQWVEYSRSIARFGLRSYRVDLSGLADSPVHRGQLPRQIYAPEAIGDVIDIATAVSPSDPSNVVLVGLCSGAYLALEAGIRLKARGVVAISPVLDMALPVPGRPNENASTVIRERSRIGRVLLRLPAIKAALLSTPTWLWRLAHALRLQPSASDGFKPVVAAVADTLVVCDEYDGRRYLDRGRWIVDRLSATGHFQLVSLPGADHSLLTRPVRRAAGEVVVPYLVRKYAPHTAADVSERLSPA